MGRHEQRVEPQCAPQLVHPGGGAPGRELDAPEQQVHRGIVRVDAGRLLRQRARRLELPALERVLGLRHELGQVGRERAPLALHGAGVDQRDEARALEPEQGLRHFEIGAPQLRGDGAQIALAVHHGQHLPLRWQQVEPALLAHGGERRDDAQMGDAAFDPRPLVDAARAFHEQRLRRDADRRFCRHVRERAFGEREVAFTPAHQLEHDLLDLEADLALDLARRDGAERHQNLADPALVALALLHVAPALQVGLGDLAGAQQQGAERVRVGADLREDDGAAVEVHRARVVTQLGGDAQHPRLAAQVEQLEDVVDAELAKRSLDRHGLRRVRREDVLQVERGARVHACTLRERPARVEPRDLFPRLHGLAVAVQPGQHHA